jgi:membrane associated rhomboid family serine protease
MFALIPARSERQAMDWSLVLVSQGIETGIERDPETGRWQLAVPLTDRQRAAETIRQYRIENRRRVWLKPLPWTGLILDWRSALWFLVLILIFALSEAEPRQLKTAGIMDSPAVWNGQWWRLFTAITLHADVAHLVSNATTGLLLLGLAMGSFGPGFGLLAAYLAGAGGNLAGLFLHAGHHRGLGASGMIMGALGMLAAQSLGWMRAGAQARQVVVRSFGGGVLLLILFGTNPATDVLAHVAGFVSGCLLGGVLLLLPPRALQNAWANHLAALACGGLVALTWALALR